MSTVDELFFVHIPKNGGRSIVAVGKSNNINWGYHYWKTQDVKLWHVPYAMYKYPKDPLHCFAVVRNPYERLISAYNFANREDTINNLMNNEESAKRFNQWIFSKVLDVQPLLEDVKSNAKFAEQLEDDCNTLMAEVTKKDKEFWKENQRTDYFLSAEESLELGIIDKSKPYNPAIIFKSKNL